MRILETGFTSPDSTQAMAVDAGLTPKNQAPPQTKPPKPSLKTKPRRKSTESVKWSIITMILKLS